MDTSLNINNRGQQFELQFPPIDPSTYESQNGYSDAGPTRIRRSRLHTTTPYSRNNNSNNFSAQADDTSKDWLRALINKILPSFMSKILGLTGSRRDDRRVETALGQINDNEMDIDQQHQDGIQGRLVQSNRIFMESVQSTINANGLSSRSRRRSEMTQNNAIKRKRSETSIEVVEENLRRQAQIEDQNHKPDLKELYYKNIDPNWYKPFKNNPDNYPKFSSSSRVTSDTYGPDQNLNLSKESPPLKKFKPSVIPTSHWFDYYPQKDEDMIDKRRTENIVEKRKAEEKTIEKEKALHKSKKGKKKAADIKFENGKEKSGTSTSPIRISPLKDQNYFAINTQTPVLASSVDNRSQIPSTIVSPSKISIPTDEKLKSIITTPDTTAQNTKSPSSMESVVYTHENKESSLEQAPVNGTFANLAENKNQSTSIGNNGSLFSFQKNQPLVSDLSNDVLGDNSTSTSLIIGEKNDGQTPAPLSIEPNKVIEPSKVIEPNKVIEPIDKKPPQEKIESTSLATEQDNIDDNSLPKDNQSLLSPFTTLTSNNSATLNNTFSPSSLFGNLKDQSPVSITMDTHLSNDYTDDEKGKRESSKTLISQPQDNNNTNSEAQLKKSDQEATPTKFSFLPVTASKPDSPFSSVFTSTNVPTSASTSGPSFSFGSSAFNGIFSNDSNNNIEKSDKMDRSSKSRRLYSSSMNNRNKRNKRASGASVTNSVSPFGSGIESASSQPPWTNGGIQTHQTPTPSSSMFNNSTPVSTPSFSSSVFPNPTPPSTTAFGFGTSAITPASAEFTSSATTMVNFFASQNSTAPAGFGMSSVTTTNFNNPTMQNGQPNNSFLQPGQQGFNFNFNSNNSNELNNPANGSAFSFSDGKSVHLPSQPRRRIKMPRSRKQQ
ncbi:hypothetical protein RhiirA1_520262 [Rhizophagus irregularis]|uniref:Uncharacterized protein n=1 Tax=Rhizophagus irregularis TaxID=588596 RepID=A0A2I1F6S0_9GLOM|nr:hypothetical protein RhiirA1_520262 [Rhizophagus irregularis]PKY30075.1 hypothetical protein RhiirB3_485420 [Rhizophagus irregularis]CAB4482767.1 unnamed protein product [Rhizophagus irregularis]CAB5372244.1 unnamed protein product [Rhizophagus irregularis]